MKPPNVTYVSLVMSVPDGTLPAEIKVAQPYTYHFFWTPRGDCQYDSLWSQPAGRFEYFRGELEFLKQKQDEYKLTLIDICVNSPSKPTESIPREFGIVLQARNKVRVIEVRQTLEKNRLEWKRLAASKHRPVAIGVTVTPAGTTIAHSVWHSISE